MFTVCVIAPVVRVIRYLVREELLGPLYFWFGHDDLYEERFFVWCVRVAALCLHPVRGVFPPHFVCVWCACLCLCVSMSVFCLLSLFSVRFFWLCLALCLEASCSFRGWEWLDTTSYVVCRLSCIDPFASPWGYCTDDWVGIWMVLKYVRCR